MDKKSLLYKYVKLLDLVEDYYTTGCKQNRERQPGLVRLPAGKPRPVIESHPRPGQPGPPETANVPSLSQPAQAYSKQLSPIIAAITQCTRCPLHQHRQLPVPGAGSVEPLVLVIAEAPDTEEDRAGLPFVGEVGEYFDKWLKAVQWRDKATLKVLKRESNIFITPIVKCCPPVHRDPGMEELNACFSYLEQQITVLKPRAILTLGRFAPALLLKSNGSIDALRGSIQRYHDIPVVPTYHPVAVLHNPQLRSLVWHDLKLLIAILEKIKPV
jgi:DNA polymerase